MLSIQQKRQLGTAIWTDSGNRCGITVYLRQAVLLRFYTVISLGVITAYILLGHSTPPRSLALPLVGCAIVLSYKQLFCKQSGEIVGYLRLRILDHGQTEFGKQAYQIGLLGKTGILIQRDIEPNFITGTAGKNDLVYFLAAGRIVFDLTSGNISWPPSYWDFPLMK